MTVFIYEYICGGGLAGRPLPHSLAREGWAMLASIVEDFARIQGCEVMTTLDERLADRPLPAHHIWRIGAKSRSGQLALVPNSLERHAVAELAARSDWSLVIAPETGGVLFDRVRSVEQAGGRLLGPTSAAVAVATDKLECARVLERAGVPAVGGAIVPLDGLPRRALNLRYPVVLKPRDGAGSQATFVIRDPRSVDSAAACARHEAPEREFVLQPYMQGVTASVSFLIGQKGLIALMPSEQFLSGDDRLRYCGGRLPLEPDLARRAIALGTRAVAAVPGLRGYVGVDMVLGAENLRSQIPDFRSQDIVIEINPRLTTSYVGLRRLARANLAELQWRIVAAEECPPIEWRPGSIGFSADGRVAYSVPDPGSIS
jgi:hypothetical protein